MELPRLMQVVRRWWWLVLGLPAIAFAGGVWLTSDPPYESIVRATVLIPGDTEIPGSAERPELMVLDDAPVLVGSWAFAQMVVEALPAVGGPALLVEDVESALAGERYSRVLTVRVTRDDASEAQAIAEAAASILPDAVNTYLVVDGGDPATVRIIDPPTDPAPANANRWLIIAVETLVALIVGVGLAVLAESLASSAGNVDTARSASMTLTTAREQRPAESREPDSTTF